MFDTASASNAVKFALLEGQLLTREIGRTAFVERAASLGLPAAVVAEAADKFMAIAANQAARRAVLRSSYDYIVVGSGASGSVVARRLAENRDAQVFLLEAGGEDLKPGILITETWFFNQGGEFDWNFAAERSPSVNNRSIVQAMGKAIGGGTSINAMVWARGHKNDFDHWAKEAGDDAWNYQHVLDIYRRIEDWHGAPDPERRGRGGEVFVQPAPSPSSIAPAFLRAAESLGIPTFSDQNGVMQEGPGGAAITNLRIRDGRRLNIPSNYLYPAMDRANLTVLTGAYVNRLTVEGDTVTGVEFEWQGQVRTVKASSELVLSAGAIQTPKILMLSGIGDRAELNRFGIATVSHLPGVGRNLQDHPIIGGGLWEAPEPLPMRNNAAEANLFVKSRPELDTPDLHIWQIEAPYLSEVTGRHAVENVWSISPGLVRPESFVNQGQVCVSTERIVVDVSIADAFVAKLKQKAMTMLAGDPRLGDFALGSIVSREAAERIDSLVKDAVAKGAKLLAGGRTNGTIMEATVLDHVTSAMRIYGEETFGPVVCVVRASGVDEAVRIANETDYGLSAAVYSRDVTRALAVAKRIESGMCHINGPTVQDEPQMPFGGVKGSGYGHFGGKASVAEFTELRWITISSGPGRYPI